MDYFGSSGDETKDLRKQQESLRAEIKKLLAWDADFMHLFEQFGGHEAYVETKRAELAEVGASLRGLKDIPSQRISQEAHCKKLVKQVDAALAKHTTLQEQLAEAMRLVGDFWQPA